MCIGSAVSNLKWISFQRKNSAVTHKYLKKRTFSKAQFLCVFAKSHRLQKVLRRTCRWRYGSSGCTPVPGPRAAGAGGRAPGLACGSAWPPTWPSGGSPESWTWRGPGSGPAPHRLKALGDKRQKVDKRGWAIHVRSDLCAKLLFFCRTKFGQSQL